MLAASVASAAVAAPAGAEPWLSGEVPALGGAGQQASPALAIDPADPLSAALAVSSYDDAGLAAQTRIAYTRDGGASWVAAGTPPRPPGTTSAGSPSVAWGRGDAAFGFRPVYLAGLRRGGQPGTSCVGSTGVEVAASLTGGVGWASEPVEVAEAPDNGTLAEPRIALAPDSSSGPLLVAYTRLAYPTATCSDPASLSGEVWLATANSSTGPWYTQRVSPSSAFGAGARYGSPALTVLPGGRAVIAYADVRNQPGAVLTTTCSGTNAATYACGAPTSVDDQVNRAAVVGARDAGPQPAIAAAGDGRVVVAWAEATASNGVRLFSATTFDAGQHYTRAARVTGDGGAASELQPAMAAAGGGRVDLAYLATSGAALAPMAVAAPPSTGAGADEAWAQPVALSGANVDPGSAPAGAWPGVRGVAVASAAQAGPSPLPATILAWSDGRGGVADVWADALRHGSVAPTLADQSLDLSRGAEATVRVPVSDADGDPLHVSIAPAPSLGTADISDSRRAAVHYRAPAGRGGSDSFKVVVSDGVHDSTATVNVNLANGAPTIGCPPLTTERNVALPLPLASCANDPDGDPVAVTAEAPVNGTLSSDGRSFVPGDGFTGEARLTLVASDGVAAPVRATVGVRVQLASARVAIRIVQPTRTVVAVRQPVVFRVRTSGVAVASAQVRWTFSDLKRSPSGSSVAHVFRKPGTYRVVATAGGGSAATLTVRAVREPLQLISATIRDTRTVAVRVTTRVPGRLTVGLARQTVSRTVKVKAGRHTVLLRVARPLPRLGTVVATVRLKPSRKPSLPLRPLKRAITVPALLKRAPAKA